MNLKALAVFALISLVVSPCVATEDGGADVSKTAKLKASLTVAQKISDVKTVFVAPLGTGEGAELIRQKVINRLVKSGVVQVVESEDDADAVLKGEAEVNKRHYFTMNGGYAQGGTKVSALGVVRLVGNKKQILWVDETRSKNPFRSVSSSVADKIANRLVEAIVAGKEKIASSPSTGL
jgi:hypothetical protein